MSGAVNVSVVTVSGLVLYVRGVDCDTAFLFFGSVVDLVEGLNFRETVLCQHSGDGSGEGGLAVVDVTDGANVYVRLGSFEFLFSHNFCCYIWF